MLLRGWNRIRDRRHRRRQSRPRRRWWQVLCRLALVIAVALVAAYVSLPWWAPVGHIRRYIAHEMVRQMGGPDVIDVSSKRLRLSWTRGIELQSLMIGSPGEKGGVPMIMIERVRADLSPLDMFLRKRLAWMTIENLRLNIEIDKKGNLNVAPLSKLRFDAEAERMTVHRAVAVLKSPDSRRPLQLNISDIEFVSGRLRWLGRVTMSASLAQSPNGAPVSLHLSGDSGGDSPAAAVFNFTNVDLAQLGLERIFKLPLRRLTGRCSGSLDLQLGRQAVIDRFRVDLKIAGLDVQPIKGPKLPVVKHAGLSIEAAYDPITGKLDVQKGKVVLPGIDLQGRATVFAGQAAGGWQAIKSLELADGTIHPARLAALLTGKAQTLGKLTITGPIKIKKLRLQHEGPKLIITGGLTDATSAQISHGGAVIKPAGRKLSLGFDGAYDERSRQLTVHDLRLVLGGNTIIARGLLPNLNRLVARLSKLTDPPKPKALLGLLAEPELHGTWEIHDAPSLLALVGGAKAAPNAVDFRGAASGQWRIQQSSGAGVHLSAVMPPEAQLAVFGLFVKPRASVIRLDMSGSLDPAAAAITDIEMDLSVGAGQVGIDGGRLSLAGGKDARLEASGTFRTRQFQDLLACLQNPPRWVRRARGSLGGQYLVRLKPRGRGMSARATLTELDLSLGEEQVEPAAAGPSAPPDRITGGMSVDASFGWHDGVIDMDVACDARAIQYVWRRGRKRSKAAGVPAAVYLAGRFAKNTDAVTTFTIDSQKPCRVVFGGSRLQLYGTVCRVPVAKASGKAGPLDGLGAFGISVDAVCAVDEPLAKLLPEVGALARKHTLGGTVKAGAEVTRDGKGISVKAHLDAAKLAVKNAAGITKPLDLLADVNVAATVSADLKRLNVQHFRLAVGQVGIEGSGLADITLGTEASPVLLAPTKLRVVARTARADTLDALLPVLKGYVLAGDARLEAEWVAADDGCIPDLKFTTNGLGGRFRGKDVKICGRIVLSDVKAKGGKFIFSRAKTDGLSIRIGKNDMHLLADVSDLPVKPAGTVHLLGKYLDTRDLAEWLQPGGGSEPPGKPPGSPGKLSAKDAEALANKTQRFINKVRPYMMSADLAGRVDMEHLVTYDPAVGQSYEARHFSLRASAVRGQGELTFTTLVNGGTVSTRYDVHFADAAPSVTIQSNIRDVSATKNIQPQLARYFPGNTVYGYFNRTEDLAVPLRDMLANAVDSRYALRAKGTSKTVTLDGLVQGRAAPKFVTRIFRGLNLTKYRYRKMTSFAKHKPDGSTYNDMVFDGYRYDLYMEGTTDTKSIGRYEVGLILLGTPQSAEWNHKYRQGRIPILKSKSRIEGGKRHDEEVSYPWPNQTLFTIFLKNNIFYRIWLQSRQK